MKRLAIAAALAVALVAFNQNDARAQFGIGFGNYGGYGGPGGGLGYGGMGYGGLGYSGLGYGGMGYGSGIGLNVGPSIGYNRVGYGGYGGYSGYSTYRPSYSVGYGNYNTYRPAYYGGRQLGYRRCR